MCSDDVLRAAIVEALDELGERDNLSYAQRTASDEPYPPSVVEDRLEALRRSQRILRIMLVAVVLVGTLLLVGADFGWTVPSTIVGVELLPMIPAVVYAVYSLVHEAKVLQLYTLLGRIDGLNDPVSEAPVPEVA